jgi:protein TonB
MAPGWSAGDYSERAFHRALTWSFGVHLGVLLVLVAVPRDWLKKPAPRQVMTVSLGGTPGPRTTGTTNIGGRTIEQASPPPKRPEPVRPAPPKVQTETVPMRAAPQPPAPPRVRETVVPMTAAPRPPVTGPQVTRGNTAVETGAHGLGAGLTLGGGTGGEMDLKNFCCPDYLTKIADSISSRWKRAQPDRGLTIIAFTIHRDGSKSDVTIEQPSGSGVLDRASRAAVEDAQFPPLPRDYTFDTLTVHLKFPYGVQ